MFPTPLAILVFFAPESPWWLVRKGRLEEAANAVGRLGRRSRLNITETVAMMRRVVELEKSTEEPSYIELFKDTDLYRTLIVCGVYLAQNLTGNLIANQAVYFFERELPPLLSQTIVCADPIAEAGVSTDTAFALGLITSALQMIFVMLSWILTMHLGRRTIYLWGSAFNVVLLVAPGCCRLCWQSRTQPLWRRRHWASSFCPVHAGACTRLMGHHWRNVSHPLAAPYHWSRTRLILHH